MVILSEFRMGLYRDAGHREDAPHFIFNANNQNIIPWYVWDGKMKSLEYPYRIKWIDILELFLLDIEAHQDYFSSLSFLIDNQKVVYISCVTTRSAEKIT